MKKLLFLAVLIPSLSFAGDYLGVIINTNGFTKTHSDTVAVALKAMLNDTAPVDFMALPIVRDPPAQKRFYALWADQAQIQYFTNAPVTTIAANLNAWLDTQGPLKNSIAVVAATNVASSLQAEIEAGYQRMETQP